MPKLTILLLVAILGLPACGGDDAAVVGTWKFDYEASEAALDPDLERVAKGPARQQLRKDAREFLRRNLGGLDITLNLKEGGDAEFIRKGRGPETRYVGQWRHDGRKGEVVVSAKGATERYKLRDETLRYLVEVSETDGAGKRTVELVLKRQG